MTLHGVVDVAGIFLLLMVAGAVTLGFLALAQELYGRRRRAQLERLEPPAHGRVHFLDGPVVIVFADSPRAALEDLRMPRAPVV